MTDAALYRDGPAAVVADFFRAYEAHEWAQVVALTHPDYLDYLRRETIKHATEWRQAPSLDESDPSDMPPAVLEYFRKIHQRFAKLGNPVLREMDINTLEQLRAMTREQLLMKFLEAKVIPPERYSDGRGPVRRRAVIGTVLEAEDQAHVVYRLHTDMGSLGSTHEMLVITARYSDNNWRVVLNDEVSYRRGGTLEAITDE